MASRIVSTQKEFVTPWFELISKRVKGSPDPYYSLRMQDYVAVVAFTEQEELILIRQYRPAVDRCTLELPCGHVEENEAPAESAQRELAEESGFHATQLELLGTLLSDTGRHENRLWCYYAKSATPVSTGYTPESGLERLFVPRSALPQLMVNGEFDHALHLAAFMLAVVRHGPDLLALK